MNRNTVPESESNCKEAAIPKEKREVMRSGIMTLKVTLFRLLLSCEYLPIREQELSILDKNVSVKLHKE